MNKNNLSLWLLLTLASGATAVWAELADRNKPMQVESDALSYDDVRQVSVFTGNVVLTKGSILIRGGQIEVRQDPQGYQYGLVTSAPGRQAFFRQKREGLDEYIEGEGDTIEYDGKADTVRFVNKAQLRRLRGAVVADEVSGALIVYENLSDKFTVNGAPRTASSPPGRVRAMLSPKPQPASSATRPSPAASGGLELQPTPQLDKAAP